MFDILLTDSVKHFLNDYIRSVCLIHEKNGSDLIIDFAPKKKKEVDRIGE